MSKVFDKLREAEKTKQTPLKPKSVPQDSDMKHPGRERGMVMLRRKSDEDRASTGEVKAYLGKGTSFEGKIRSEGMFRIDGKCQGEIVSGDSLVIGDTGEVNGQINVSNLLVKGKLGGKIEAKDRIEITPSGEIRGDIETSSLVILEGAILEGNCKMEKEQTGLDEKVSFLKTKESEKEEVEEEKTQLLRTSKGKGNDHQGKADGED
jgi:cytoskeletal protein CcmA (bactofilin family)